VHRGKIVRIEKFGVFVDIGAEKPGLVHISELAAGYVTKPEDVVQKGDEVDVKVINVNRRKKQIDLSMKVLAAAQSQAVSPEDQPEEVPTAMALALQKALKRDAPGSGSDAGNRKTSRQENNKQEEILRRTLHRLESK
jgi:predicted RNA-binding protein with RPS1 domain